MHEKRTTDRALTGLTMVIAVLMVYLLVLSGTGLSLMKHSPPFPDMWALRE